MFVLGFKKSLIVVLGIEYRHLYIHLDWNHFTLQHRWWRCAT